MYKHSVANIDMNLYQPPTTPPFETKLSIEVYTLTIIIAKVIFYIVKCF